MPDEATLQNLQLQHALITQKQLVEIEYSIESIT